jgi:hypothetical protein
MKSPNILRKTIVAVAFAATLILPITYWPFTHWAKSKQGLEAVANRAETISATPQDAAQQGRKQSDPGRTASGISAHGRRWPPRNPAINAARPTLRRLKPATRSLSPIVPRMAIWTPDARPEN